jgi:hypothetical protein
MTETAVTPPEAAARLEYNHRIEDLERSVLQIRSELAAQRVAKEQPHRQTATALPIVVRQLIEITNDLVPGEIRIENSIDPDYPETTHIVFHVTPVKKFDDVDSIIDSEIQWHRRAREVFPEATCYFRLALD